jgi:Bacterial regulatory protein, Fis family
VTATPSPTQDGRRVPPVLSDGSPTAGWHEAIRQFKRTLLEQALARANGNRTRAAMTLGLQRTYFLRLIRDLRIAIPPASHDDATRSTAAAKVIMATPQRRPAHRPGRHRILLTQGRVQDESVRGTMRETARARELAGSLQSRSGV